jgi:hypothetical protein
MGERNLTPTRSEFSMAQHKDYIQIYRRRRDDLQAVSGDSAQSMRTMYLTALAYPLFSTRNGSSPNRIQVERSAPFMRTRRSGPLTLDIICSHLDILLLPGARMKAWLKAVPSSEMSCITQARL